MKLIVAADNNWAIGRSGAIPWHIAGDMKFFRETTTGNVIVMGRRTLESFPHGRPLPDRVNIVLTRNADYKKEGVLIVHSEEELSEAVSSFDPGRVFVTGGAEIYKQLLHAVDTCLVTRVDGEFPADTYFPDLDKCGDFRLAWESEEQEENGIRYRFTGYERI